LPEAAALGVTIREAIADAARELAGAGCEMPRLDAEVLLGAVLDCDRARLVLDSAVVLDPADLRSFRVLVARRAAREPVAYIVGFREFRRIRVAVDRRVLIPRPETELLVEAALALVAGTRVVDVGTGSGAVALALKDERPDLVLSGVDISADAIAVAAANGARLGLDVRWQVGDLLAGVSADAVLANLPYVSEGAELAPEIERFEPAGALFAGPDGLDVIRRLVRELDGVPFVALEVGFDQADAVAALLVEAGYSRVDRRRDLAGHERVIVGRR
jgi:release factor glutamine methyltransferase